MSCAHRPPAPVYAPTRDYYRDGYEAVRTGLDVLAMVMPSGTVLAEADLESYQRGVQLAQQVQSVGCVLQPWSAGRYQPPVTARYAKMKFDRNAGKGAR